MTIKTYAEFEVFRNIAETLQSEVWTMLKDKSIPLNERWKVFVEASGGVINKVNSYYMDFQSMTKAGFGGSWYDDFYLDRHQTMELTSLVECLEDRNNLNSDSKRFKMTEEQIEELKEEILQSGYTGFVFDW